MPYVVIALLLVCLPPFFFFAFLSCFCFIYFFLDHTSLLLHFPFQSNLSSLPCFLVCRSYCWLFFPLTVPLPAPRPAQRHGDGAEQPGTASATWVTGPAAPLLLHPCLLPAVSLPLIPKFVSPLLCPVPRHRAYTPYSTKEGRNPSGRYSLAVQELEQVLPRA